MAFTRAQANQLLNKTEMRLFDDSRANALRGLDRSALDTRIARARDARDRSRDLLKRQRVAARKSAPAGRDGVAARTARKEALLVEILERFTTARREAPAMTATKKAAKKAVPAPAKKATTKTTKKAAKAPVRTVPAGSRGAGQAASEQASAGKERTKKAATKKTAATKTATRKAAAKETAATKTAAKKTAAKKMAAKKTVAKKAATTEQAATKSAATKSAAARSATVSGAASAGGTSSSQATASGEALTPERALENTRQLLEAKQERDRTSQPWQSLDPAADHVPQPGYQSSQAASKAQELHAAEARLPSIHGSISTRDRLNQGKRDHRGDKD